MSNSIDSFTGDYHFLSNFHLSPMGVRVLKVDMQASTVEHAFQAMKATNINDRLKVLNAGTPGAAKKAGRSIPCREDWDKVKVRVMRELVLEKFKQNPRLADKLLATGDAELIEGNWWGDRFWGVCRGQGQNNLGKILMWVRSVLRQKQAPIVASAVAGEGEGESEEAEASSTTEVTTPLSASTDSAPHYSGPFALMDRWRDNCQFWSFDWQIIKDQDFGAVCHLSGAADEAIRRLEQGEHWVGYFILLSRLLNYDPTNPTRDEGLVRGNVAEMASEWVDWYRNRQNPSYWSRKSDVASEQQPS